MPSPEPLTALAPDLFVASRPLRLAIGDPGARMTVARTGGDLWVHSPVPLDAATRRAVDGLGRVRWLVGPNDVHHLFLPEWVRAYPDAELWGTPGLPAKRPELRFHALFDGSQTPGWGDALRHLRVAGIPRLQEVVFLHPASRTLVLTDLAFHVTRDGRNRARLFHWLVGATGRFGPHRLVRALIRDRAALRRSLDAVLAWDFDRIVVSHGEVLESGGRERLTAAFAFLRPP